MKKIVILGAGAMGSAFTVPCVDNNNDVTLVGTHLEEQVINNINDNNNFHEVLKFNLPKELKIKTFDHFQNILKTKPDLIVIGVSSKGIEWAANELSKNLDVLKKGLVNLERHINNTRKFGLPVMVAVNHFITDSDNEMNLLLDFCKTPGVKASKCTHWSNGSAGTEELAKNVVEICEDKKDVFKYLYEDDLPLFKKIEKIAQEIYHASEVMADTKVRRQLKDFEENGFGKLPVCIAKTQYSFSTDPSLKGAPTGHALPVREVRLSSGAEFIVVICGEVMTMPGLPRVPAADSIKLNDKGEIEGLF